MYNDSFCEYVRECARALGLTRCYRVDKEHPRTHPDASESVATGAGDRTASQVQVVDRTLLRRKKELRRRRQWPPAVTYSIRCLHTVPCVTCPQSRVSTLWHPQLSRAIRSARSVDQQHTLTPPLCLASNATRGAQGFFKVFNAVVF